MLIPSNLIIQDLLVFYQAKNTVENGTEEKIKKLLEYLISTMHHTIWSALDTSLASFTGVEPISDTTKEKIKEAGYNTPEDTSSPERFLVEFMLASAEKNLNPTFDAPILTRLLNAYETISNTHHLECATLILNTLNRMQEKKPDPGLALLISACETQLLQALSPPALPKEEAKKTMPIPEIISVLIQNPNNPEDRDAYLDQLFTETNITHETQEKIIACIKAGKKGCLSDLKTMVNHYIFNHPQHHQSIASMLETHAAPTNALLLILCIGQT
ncbi:MAG TPA: hypothetical protein VFU82_08490, partial [Gammaproteobacteria bacterium]|nr:hypothetical protein [Gammaproteobacteria bacterium]